MFIAEREQFKAITLYYDYLGVSAIGGYYCQRWAHQLGSLWF